MTTTFQLSEKGNTGDAIFVVKVEAPDEVSPQAAYNVFAQAVIEAGLGETLDNFDALAKARQAAINGLGATPVQPGLPPSGPPIQVPSVQQTMAQPAAQAWGQPPVAPYQPPQLPSAAAPPAVGAPPACHHGAKVFISGTTKQGPNAGKPWKAWACPADKNDPSKCDKEWIRD